MGIFGNEGFFGGKDGLFGGNSDLLFFIIVFLVLFNGGFGFGRNQEK